MTKDLLRLHLLMVFGEYKTFCQLITSLWKEGLSQKRSGSFYWTHSSFHWWILNSQYVSVPHGNAEGAMSQHH